MKDPGQYTEADWNRAGEIATDFNRVRLQVLWGRSSDRYRRVFKKRYPIEFAVIEGVLKNGK